MKHIKHIHDEDYDFSIKLMVPLLTILVCTICLCATTWAWYTASVSTGVNSIKAGAYESTVNISYTANTLSVDEGISTMAINKSETLDADKDGIYTLEKYVDCLFDITNDGLSTSGYHCMLTIYTDEYTSVFYTDKLSEQAISFRIISELDNVKLKIDTMWGNPPDGSNIIYADETKYLGKGEDCLVLSDTSTFSFNEEQNDEPIPSYKYIIRFVDNATYQELKDSISLETPYETVLLDDYLIEGYEIVSANYDDLDEQGMWFYIDPDKETNDFVVYYQKIETEEENNNSTEIIEDTKDDEQVDAGASNTEITPGEMLNEQQSTDGQLSSESKETTDDAEQSDTVASLLIVNDEKYSDENTIDTSSSDTSETESVSE